MKFLFNLRNKFRMLRSDMAVLFLAYRDKRTPVSTKLILGFTILYFFSPIDIIPDFIPLLGFADELFVVPSLISLAVKTVPEPVLFDARLRLKKTKSTLKNILLAILILSACALLAYYGYQYYNENSY